MRTIPLLKDRPRELQVLLGALGGRLRRVVVKPPADEQPAAAEADPGT